MALYEDTEQTPWDRELARYQGAGTITNETTGETSTVPSAMTNQGQPQQDMPQGQMPQGGDINQFLDWAVKNKLGFNPFTMNPTTEALNMWNQKESEFFNKTFANSGITPSSMTPEALKHWNQQKKEGLSAFIQEAEQRQKNGVAYLQMLKQGWEEENSVAGRLELPTGEKLLVNKFGRGIRNAQAVEPGQGGGDAMAQISPAGSQNDGFLKEPAKKKEPTTSAEERKRYVDTKMLLNMTNKVEELLNDKDAGDWVGPVSGRIGQAQEKITDLPEKQIELYSTIRDMNDFVLRVRSGAQINEQEYKRLTSFLADPNLPMNNLKTRLKRFKGDLEWMQGLVARELGKGGTTMGEKPKSKFKVLGVE
jgi:hypothetical protein